MDSAAAPVVVRKPRRLRVEIIFVLLPYGRSEPADHLVYDSQSRFADQAATATHEGGLEFSESRLCDARGAGEPRRNRNDSAVPATNLNCSESGGWPAPLSASKPDQDSTWRGARRPC